MRGYRRPLFVRLVHRHAGAIAWMWREFFPCFVILAAMGGVLIMTLITIGNMPPVSETSLLENGLAQVVYEVSR